MKASTVIFMANTKDQSVLWLTVTQQQGSAINLLGTQQYYKGLFFVIIMTPNVLHYLSIKATNLGKRIDMCKLTETKKTWKTAYFDGQQKNEAEASEARDKRDGAYKTGQNVNNNTSDDGEPTKLG